MPVNEEESDDRTLVLHGMIHDIEIQYDGLGFLLMARSSPSASYTVVTIYEEDRRAIIDFLSKDNFNAIV